MKDIIFSAESRYRGRREFPPAKAGCFCGFLTPSGYIIGIVGGTVRKDEDIFRYIMEKEALSTGNFIWTEPI